MRSIWKGALSFGLVTIPVKVYGATQQNDVSFHQVHVEDAGRIRYKRVCELDGEEVPYEDVAKGYELPSGETVVLTDEDFASLPLPSGRAVDVLQFVPAEQVDPIYFAKSYYLEPDAQGLKPYVLLREALEQSGRVGIVKVALRQRESLATLRVREGVLVLETMLWPDEIRDAEFGFLDETVDVRPQELKMASSLIDTMTDDFDPEQYTDEYREALEAVITAKVEGREVVEPAEPEKPGKVVDLMAALQASVENARGGRDAGSGRATKKAAGGRSSGSAARSSKSARTAKTAKGATASKPSRAASRSSAKSASSSRGSAKKAGAKAAKKSVGKARAKKSA